MKPGTGTLEAEVSSISGHGFWIFLGDRELFVSFKGFPGFKPHQKQNLGGARYGWKMMGGKVRRLAREDPMNWNQWIRQVQQVGG